MKRSVFPRLVLLLAALGMPVGAGLRVYQLTRCMNEVGLIIPGSRILYGMLGFSLIGVVVIAVLCFRLNKVRGGEDCFEGRPVFLFLDLAAATAMFFGCLQRYFDGGSALLFLGGMVAAACLATASLLYGKRSQTTFWLLLLPCVFFAAQIISDFKGWSSDPLVIDFCFRLLTQVCALLAIFHISGFALGYGRKRMTVFWSVGASVFAAMSAPDFFVNRSLPLGQLLLLCGAALWCASHAIRILGEKSQSQTAPEGEPFSAPKEEPQPKTEDAPRPEE